MTKFFSRCLNCHLLQSLQFHFRKMSGGGGKQAIFVGDSILQWFTRDGHESWAKYFTSKYNCVNLGVPGDSTDQTIQRLTRGGLLENGKILPSNVPKVCTLLVGTNDIGRGQTEAYIAGRIEEIINILKDKLGDNMKILLIGIIPRVSLSQKPGLVNQIISQYEDGYRIKYLDISNCFYAQKPGAQDGSLVLRRELYSDGLHLTSHGYKAFAEGIAPVLDEMMKE